MINLYELLNASNGQLFGEPTAQLFESFATDYETATVNQLFVALGTSQEYIAQTIQNGVSGVICARPPECDTTGVTVILVKDVEQALLAWSHDILGKFGTKVIGVTGVAGKSTTIEAISHVLSLRHTVLHDPHLSGKRLSIPLALAHLNAEHKFAVLKLGASQTGELATIIQAVQPEVGVVTHIGSIPNTEFESLQQLADEMRLLVNYLSPSGLAVLNYDDDLVRGMGSQTRASTKTIGITGFGADLMAYNVKYALHETRFELRHSDARFINQSIPLLGKLSVYGALCAMMIGLHYDIPIIESLNALSKIAPLPGRMNPLKGKNGALLIDDTYNANPFSALSALEWLSAVKSQGKRSFFIFGDMGRLGANIRTGHRLVGQRASQVADVFIARGQNAGLAARSALDNNMDTQNVMVTHATNDTVNIVNSYALNKDDIILIKGDIGARMELVTSALLDNPDDQNKLVRQNRILPIFTFHNPTRLSWVEINFDALAGNIRAIKRGLSPETTLMAVVKSDAYGHGAISVAETALANGAGYLGVSSLEEALILRDAGIVAPIIALNYTPFHLVHEAIQQNITLALFDLTVARTYDRIARENNGKVRVHVKIDTGIGRLGVLPDDALTLFRNLLSLKNIEVEGIYTHFSVADEKSDHTANQLTIFKNLLRDIQTLGYKFKYIHAGNSAGTLAHPDGHFTMARTGAAMYGIHPSPIVSLPTDFNPVMSWKTIIAQVKTLPPNHPIGYGNTYTTQTHETIAVIPVGYADGFRRAPHSWREVLVHGQRAKVIGRVSMEKSVISISHIPDVSVGDEVVLLGKQGSDHITAEEIASQLGTISYEVVCSVLPRVPRR
ncbi:MAG: alanine racemase [bacterium]|nr:alanine racemase [bacterium]